MWLTKRDSVIKGSINESKKNIMETPNAFLRMFGSERSIKAAYPRATSPLECIA
jgi:hypothetical protein